MRWLARKRGNKPSEMEEPLLNDGSSSQTPDPSEKKDSKPPPPPPVSFFKLFKYADSLDFALVFVGAVASIGVGVVMPLFSLIFGGILDAFNGSNAAQKVDQYSLYFLYLAIASFSLNVTMSCCFSISSERQIRRMREQYLASALRQEIGWFDTSQPGELATRIKGDTLIVQEGIGMKLARLIQFSAQFVAGFAIGFSKGWELSLIMLSVVPFLGGAALLMVRSLVKAAAVTQKSSAEAGAVAEEAISSIRTVAAFTGEGKELSRYQSGLERAKTSAISAGLKAGILLGVMLFIVFCSYAVGMSFGARQVANDLRRGCVGSQCKTGGDVLTVFWAVLQGAMSIGQCGPNINALAEARGAAGHLEQVNCRQSAIDAASTAGAQPASVQGKLELRDVVFRYPSRTEALVFDRFNLTVEAGTTVALVGASGNGKSTVVSLIERFYDPERGTVLLDGRDIRELNVQWLRSTIGLVSQEPVLFSSSIAENIAYGKPGASMLDITTAAKAANAHNFITAFPDGYDTLVGDRGIQLSGGQKQRVAIARAMLKDPTVLLLDEATSALDQQSERIVQEALDRLLIMRKRTTIIIAHRLSTIRGADSIAVVADGAIVERGTHAELMALHGGKYKALVQLQLGPAAGDPDADAHYAHSDNSSGSSSSSGEQHTDIDSRGSPPVSPPANATAGDSTTAASAGAAASYSTSPLLQRQRTGSSTSASSSTHMAASSPKRSSSVWSDARDRVDSSASATAAVASSFMGGVSPCAPTFTPQTPHSERGSFNDPADSDRIETPLLQKQLRQSSSRGAAKHRFTKPSGGKDASGSDEQEPPRVSKSRLWALGAPERKYFAAALAASTFSGAVFPAFALILSSIISFFYLDDPDELQRKANKWSLLFVVLAVVVAISTFIQLVSYTIQGECLTARLRSQTFQAILRQDMAFFDKPSNSTGALTARLATEATLVKAVAGQNLGRMYQNVMTVVAAFVVAFVWGDVRLTAILAGVLPLLVLASIWQMRVVRGSSTKSQEAVAAAGALAVQAIDGIRTVTAFNMAGPIMELYRKGLRDPLRQGIKRGLVDGGMLGFSQLVMLSAYGFVFWYGGHKVLRGEVSFQRMLRSLMAVMMAAQGVGQTSSFLGDSAAAEAAASRIFSIIDRQPTIDSGTVSGTTPRSVNGRLELRDVVFAYPSRPDATVFKKLNLTVEAGTTVALVGASGNGKSTVVSLIERFYDPERGTVLLDGRDIRELNVQWLRSTIGLVSQEPVLFSSSIAENIAYGKPGASMLDITTAAKAANAHDFITAFPDGYDTRVGDKGVQCSGGQKQRIAIARAMLKDPTVLLLDEATSALDAESERVVQEALDRLLTMRKRTTIIIAHRLSTIRGADVICVVHNGDIVEKGTHTELMALHGGHYRLLVKHTVQ